MFPVHQLATSSSLFLEPLKRERLRVVSESSCGEEETILSPPCCQESERDKAFFILYHLGIIDAAGLLTDKVDNHEFMPTEKVVEEVRAFLLTPLQEVGMTILELLLKDREMADLQGAPIKSFSIVGSTVFFLLRTMLAKTLQEKLGEEAASHLMQESLWESIMEEPRDWDLRSKAPGAQAIHLYRRAIALVKRDIPFFSEKMELIFLQVTERCEYTLGRHFSRFCLFENSNLHLEIDPTSLTEDLRTLRIKIMCEERRGKNRPLQAIVDRLLKILRVHESSTINYKGAILWHLAIATGYIPATFDSYPPLLEAMLTKHEPRDNWGQRVAPLISKTAATHSKDPVTVVAMALLLELSIPPCKLLKPGSYLDVAKIEPYRKKLLRELWEWLFPATERTHLLVALRLSSDGAEELTASLLSTFLQIGGMLSLGTPWQRHNPYRVELKQIAASFAFRYQISEDNPSVYLLLSLDFKKLITELKAIEGFHLSPERRALLVLLLTNCFQPLEDQEVKEIFTNTSVLEHYATNLAPPQEVTLELLEIAERCRHSEDPILQAVATALYVAVTAWGSEQGEKLLICKVIPMLLSHSEPFLCQLGHTIATAQLLYRASERQRPHITSKLAALKEEPPLSSLRWYELLVTTCHGPYCLWVFQESIAVEYSGDTIAWTIASHGLRGSNDLPMLQGAIFQLIDAAEKLSTPIDDAEATSFYDMVATHCPQETSRVSSLLFMKTIEMNLYIRWQEAQQCKSKELLIKILEECKCNPYHFNSVTIACIAIEALIYLYIDLCEPVTTVLWLNQLSHVAATQNSKKLHDTNFVSRSFFSFFKQQRDLGFYLLFLKTLTKNYYPTLEQNKMALNLAYSLHQQLLKKYSKSEHQKPLAKALLRIMLSPVAHPSTATFEKACSLLSDQQKRDGEDPIICKLHSRLITVCDKLLKKEPSTLSSSYLELFLMAIHNGTLEAHGILIYFKPDSKLFSKIANFNTVMLEITDMLSQYGSTFLHQKKKSSIDLTNPLHSLIECLSVHLRVCYHYKLYEEQGALYLEHLSQLIPLIKMLLSCDAPNCLHNSYLLSQFQMMVCTLPSTHETVEKSFMKKTASLYEWLVTQEEIQWTFLIHSFMHSNIFKKRYPKEPVEFLNLKKQIFIKKMQFKKKQRQAGIIQPVDIVNEQLELPRDSSGRFFYKTDSEKLQQSISKISESLFRGGL